MAEEQSNPPVAEEAGEPKTKPSEPQNEDETTLGQKGFKEFQTTIQGDVKITGSGDHANYTYNEVHYGLTKDQIRQQIREELRAQFGDSEGEIFPIRPLPRKKRQGVAEDLNKR